MGYSTIFYGEINISPPLNKIEEHYLNKFSQTRRESRKSGPYFAEDCPNIGEETDDDVTNGNQEPPGQPGLWCKWIPESGGEHITWSGGEKFYKAAEWMVYIIEHFLKKNAYAKIMEPNKFSDFKEEHTLNGLIYAKGDDEDDFWKIIVKNNKIYKVDGKYTYPFDSDEETGIHNKNTYRRTVAIEDHEIDWNKVKWLKKELVKYQPTLNEQSFLDQLKIESDLIKTSKKNKRLKL